MSLFGSFDRTRHLDELNEPLETQGSGVLTPAQRRALVQSNLVGAASFDATALIQSKAAAALTDKLVSVPTVATGGVLDVHTTPTATHSIRIKSAAGTVYYVMVASASTGRGGA